MLVEQRGHCVEELLRLSTTTSLQTKAASLAEDEGRLREEPSALHDDFVRVTIVHQSSVHPANFVCQHDVLGSVVVLCRERPKQLVHFNFHVLPDGPFFCRYNLRLGWLRCATSALSLSDHERLLLLKKRVEDVDVVILLELI